MNLEERKSNVLRCLKELEEETKVLIERIAVCRTDLEKVNTIEELKMYADDHDIEEGLEHIRLF